MAKPLTLTLGADSFDLDLSKVDRAKLYGYVDTEVVDDQGRRCELATLAGDGHSVIGKGSTASAYLTHAGHWTTKAELKPVDADGKTITPVASSFDAPIALETTATVEDFLSHNVTSIYQVSAENLPTLAEKLTNSTIYTFPFSFRGGLEASAAFLLAGADGTIFLCVGTPCDLRFVGLQQAAAVISEESSDDDDVLDFSLV